MNEYKADIVILGAGIGGFEAYRTLNRYLGRAGIRNKILIVDENNYFTFVPLLHEVASASVEPIHATIPLREVISGTAHSFLRAKVVKILPEQSTVETSEGTIKYGHCVIALGSGINYFGIAGAKEFSHNVRTLAAAERLRSNLVRLLEKEKSSLQITIVGGGYTGVEVAGQLAHLCRGQLKKLYPKTAIKIRIVQGADVLVPPLPKKAQTIITKRLQKLGVEIIFNFAVKEVKESGIIFNGRELGSDFTIWCAGVSNVGNIFLPEKYCENGRIIVTNFLNLPDFKNLFAVGDVALVNDTEGAKYPQLGETADKEGRFAAQAIIADIKGCRLQPFKFHSLGTLMPIGEWFGVAIFNSFVISGRFAWWLRRTVYLLFMPGVKRKLKIVSDWTLNLFGLKHFIETEN